MTFRSVNRYIRFVLEMLALLAFTMWGYNAFDSWRGILAAIALPLFFALCWGIFAVRDDPSRSGKTVVPTPGWVRLIIELGLFGIASWMLFDLSHELLAGILTGMVIAHYVFSRDRVRWLLNKK